MNRWVADQVAGFRRLAGCSVADWIGIEMALREVGSADLPDFEDPSIPFLQLTVLYVKIGDNPLRITTYQNDTNWGLRIESDRAIPPDRPEELKSIYRTRNLVELPRGLIEGVDPILDGSGDLVEVTLTLSPCKIVIRSGEVYEEWGGGLRVVMPDESVLVSVEPASGFGVIA